MSDFTFHELKNGMSLHTQSHMQPEADAATRRLYAEIAPAIVQIDIKGETGSGFFIDKEGDIATDAHCIEGADHFTVITFDGKKHEAQLTKLDDINDLAVIRISDAGKTAIKPLGLGSSRNLKADQSLWAFGHPEGEAPIYVAPGYFRTLEKGADVLASGGKNAIDRARRMMAGMTPSERADVQIDLERPLFNARVNIMPGNSGGPIVDAYGSVVGIVDFSNGKSDSDFTVVEKLAALKYETKPKFSFVTQQTKNGLLLTDISRTDGTYRGPFVENFLVGVEKFRKVVPFYQNMPQSCSPAPDRVHP